MTRLVLAGMVERKKGAIVNIGSGQGPAPPHHPPHHPHSDDMYIICVYVCVSAAGVSTSPLLAQYGAAKAYVAMFSRALNGELAKFNVHVQCQVPLHARAGQGRVPPLSCRRCPSYP